MVRAALFLMLIVPATVYGQAASLSVSLSPGRHLHSFAQLRDPDNLSALVEDSSSDIPEAVAEVAVGGLEGTVVTRNGLRASGSFVELSTFGHASGVLTNWTSQSAIGVDVTVDKDTQALFEFENGTLLPNQGASAVLDGGFFPGDLSAIVFLQAGETIAFHISHGFNAGATPYSSVDAFARLTIVPPVPDKLLPGDFNSDGAVDAADFTVWRDKLGRHEALLAGAGDGSGEIDTGDYQLWRDHFGATISTATAAPESASAVLLFTAGGVILWKRNVPR